MGIVIGEIIVNNIIPKLAEEAVHETQLMMIMDYPSFESQLYKTFAEKVIGEVHHVLQKHDLLTSPLTANVLLKEHFGLDDE